MKEKLGNDLILKVFSLVLAILLWLFVINTEDPVITKSFSNIPVDMLNEQVLDELNRTYKITEGSTVSFTVKGKKTVLDKLKKSDFRATADVSSMSKVNSIPIKIVPLKFADQLEIVSGNNQSVKVKLEDLRRVRVPVTVETTGRPASGYAVGSKTAAPNLISISGPKSVVKQVKSIKVIVDVTGLKKDISITHKVVCYDSEGEQVDQSRLKLDNDEVKVKIKFSRTKTVPIVVKTKGTPAKGYALGSIDYSPEEIEITGEQDALEQVDEIALSTIDISNSTKSIEKTIKAADIKLPEGITFVKDTSKIEDIVVKANIEKYKKRTITLSTDQIQLINNENNYKIEFDQSEVPIKVTGLKSVVDDLTAKDLNPKIDVSDYETGTHTVQVQLKEVKNMDIIGNVQVKITVSE